MADVKRDVPGTWLTRVTLNGAPFGRAVVTFTSDGGLVERVDGRIEGLVGVWEARDDKNDDEKHDQKDGKKDEFRFMGYRYLHKLAVAPPPDVVATFDFNSRLRGTCHLAGSDVFSCTVTADRLDADEKVIGASPPLHLKLDGVRMKVVPE